MLDYILTSINKYILCIIDSSYGEVLTSFFLSYSNVIELEALVIICCILFCGLLVVFSDNQVHSIFFLILVFFFSSIMLIMIGLEFLALLYLIVYIGAVAILFLFVVMMLDTKRSSEIFEVFQFIFFIYVITFLFSYFFYLSYFYDNYYDFSLLTKYILFSDTYIESSFNFKDYLYSDLSNVMVIGMNIFTTYYDIFILGSLILLVAMIGAIVLTLGRDEYYRVQQSVLSQNYRDFSKTVTVLGNVVKKKRHID